MPREKMKRERERERENKQKGKSVGLERERFWQAPELAEGKRGISLQSSGFYSFSRRHTKSLEATNLPQAVRDFDHIEEHHGYYFPYSEYGPFFRLSSELFFLYPPVGFCLAFPSPV